MSSDFSKFIYGFKKDTPKVKDKAETLLDIFKKNNQTCNINKCSNQNINKNNFTNYLYKNYTSIDYNFINGIIDILNQKIKDKIIEMLKDNDKKGLIEKLNKIDIKGIKDSIWEKLKLVRNKPKYMEQIKDSLCEMNNYEKNYKEQFAQILSDFLCEIRACINYDTVFLKIKEMVYQNIEEMFENCKKNIG